MLELELDLHDIAREIECAAEEKDTFAHKIPMYAPWTSIARDFFAYLGFYFDQTIEVGSDDLESFYSVGKWLWSMYEDVRAEMLNVETRLALYDMLPESEQDEFCVKIDMMRNLHLCVLSAARLSSRSPITDS